MTEVTLKMAVPTVTLIAAASLMPLNIERPPLAYTEMPPLVSVVPPHDACGWSAPAALVTIPTAYDFLCVANASALPAGDPSATLGFNASLCEVPMYGYAHIAVPPNKIPNDSDWRRNYYGGFAADTVEWGGATWQFMAMHGENKNEILGNYSYQNTINVNVSVSSCASGFTNGTYTDCSAAYNAFVGGVLQNFSSATCFGFSPVTGLDSFLDAGPVAWPLHGYVNSTGGKMTYGLRQPSVVRGFDGALYVAYTENGLTFTDYHVVRAPPGLGQGLPGSFFALNMTSLAWEIPALPIGFHASNISAFFASASPGAEYRAPVFSLGEFVAGTHLALARDSRSKALLAIYDSVNYTECTSSAVPAAKPHPFARTDFLCPWTLNVRASRDAIHWSEPVVLSAYNASDWSTAALMYPAFLSADGTTQAEVDAAGFYIMGTCATCPQPPGQLGPSVNVAFVQLKIT